jgi:hypothetical protein
MKLWTALCGNTYRANVREENVIEAEIQPSTEVQVQIQQTIEV